MDHDHARLLMLFYRPGGSPDLAAEDTAALEAHFAECPSCAAAFRSRSDADNRIAAAVKSVSVPGTAKAGLIASTGVELAAAARRAWGRTAAGVGAVLVAGILAVPVYKHVTRTAIDTDAVVMDTEFLAEQPDRAAQQWLTANHLPLPGDLPLDLRLTRFRGEMELAGRPTPTLLLVTPTGHTALVHFLPPGRFDPSSAANAQASAAAARFYPGLANGWAVLVVYTGNDLRPFLLPVGVAHS